MSKIVPTISSGTAGPTGVLHLPRLWQKVSLDAGGKLHDEYPAIGAGYDAMTLAAIGIEADAFTAFVKENKPSYCATEVWVLEQNGGSLDAGKIAEHNAGVTGYIHADDTRAEILTAAGRADDGSIKDAVNLNNLDDWALFHAQELS